MNIVTQNALWVNAHNFWENKLINNLKKHLFTVFDSNRECPYKVFLDPC